MGMLTQALAGFAEGAAGTGAALMIQNQNAAIQAERDKALALRQQSLAELRENRADTRQDRLFEQQNARDDAKVNNTLTDYQDADGLPMTRGQIAEVSKTKQAAEAARKSGQDRADTENVEAGQAEALNNIVPDARTQVADSMGVPRKKARGLLDTADPDYTPEEQAAIDAGDNVKVTNTKAEAAKLKAETAAQLKEMDIAYREKSLAVQMDFKEKTLASKSELIAAQIDHLRAMGTSEANNEIKGLILQQKINEDQRKATTQQAKMISDIGPDFSEWSPEQVKIYKKLEKQAGGDPEAIDVSKPVKAEKPKGKGLLSTIGNLFSSDKPAKAETVPNPMAPTGKKLDAATAQGFLRLAKGDKSLARSLAKQEGYSF